MKNILLLFLSLLIILFSCRRSPDRSQILEDIEENTEFGNLIIATRLADSLKKYCSDNHEVFQTADSLEQIAERIGLDFSVPEQQLITQIEDRNGQFAPEEKSSWDNKGWLEWRMINGEKMYFKRAASNLMLIKSFHEQKEKWQHRIWSDPEMIFRLDHTEKVLKESDNQHNPVAPVNMVITCTISIQPDAVPAGEKIRCWLPWPATCPPRQYGVKLLKASNGKYIISPDSAVHSTIYMEEVSKKYTTTIFSVTWKYISSAQYFNLSGNKILPYVKTSSDYKKYTSEQLPHICFTENIKRLTDSITSADDTPDETVRKIYCWFKDNIPWTGALEYSIIPNIPEYVYQNSRGDCGMQTFMFMSMLRYKGIPVRWQSGWMVPPGAENLHDWCEVYYEGIGWVPMDVSYDLQNSDNRDIRYFYLSGIDSYRLIINKGVAGPLHPAKKYLRSEPYDFQRGEVEWEGGNLYFDKWNYDMEIVYLK
jgi:hypothetical protein